MDNGYEIINNQLYVLQKTKCYQYLNATLGILLERFKKKVQLAAVWAYIRLPEKSEFRRVRRTEATLIGKHRY